MNAWIERLRSFPDGACYVSYRNKRWLMRKETRLGGKLVKLYAEELGDTDFVSLNFYDAKTPLLKPCEMAEEKVIDFILGASLRE